MRNGTEANANATEALMNPRFLATADEPSKARARRRCRADRGKLVENWPEWDRVDWDEGMGLTR